MRRPLVLLLAAAACAPAPTPTPARPPAPAADAAALRLHWNQLAARRNLPLFWVADRNGNRVPDADELAPLLFYPSSERWAGPGAIAAGLPAALADLARAEATPIAAGLAPDENRRRRLVIEELDQGAPTLVRSDLRELPPAEKQLVTHVLAAAAGIDDLFARASGARALASRVPADDLASASLFRRNWGPRCVAPRTAHEPACSAIPGAPSPIVDVYPEAAQRDPAFCAALEKRPDAEALLGPFTAVREQRGALVAVPYPQAFPAEMAAIAAELRAAAAPLGDGEAALKAYLLAAAQSFGDNDWGPADEAWARMNTQSSRWYLRVGPDETYWEPCAHKAGFHLAFALINKDSLRWQEKLTPLQQRMEERLATLIGKPYAARKVSFHLPDFIDLVVNAGDDRDPLGATVGQSLPNWGKVAAEGRGRTVAMTNLYDDPDSWAMKRTQAESVFSRESMAAFPEGGDPGLLGTILHEATHNLGPGHEYAVGGKTDGLVFGGQLASMLEELKAQTGALFFITELRQAGVIDDKLARQAFTDAIFWAFSQTSRGLFDDTGRPQPYPQLATIQIGFLLDQGALTFAADGAAANGRDHGAFTLHFERMAAACETLMKQVGAIKATGDRAAAEALVARYVAGDVVPLKLISERFLRLPKQTFVYAVEK